MAKSTYCAEAGATCDPCDIDNEGARKLAMKAGETGYMADMQCHLTEKYGGLQYDKLVGRETIQRDIKEGIVEPTILKMKEEIFRRLASSPAARATLEARIGSIFDVHKGIETAGKEEGVLRRMLEPVEAKRRELVDKPDEKGMATGPRRGDFVYDVPLCKELDAMVKANPDLLKQLNAASDARMKAPESGV